MPEVVSVIIPAFNAQAYIAEAIVSARAQTYGALEILVIDDGSVDATTAIVKAQAKRDDRVRLLQMPKNAGVSAARNLGLDHATGDWIAILDADDRFKAGRIENMVRFATEHSLDLTADNLELIEFPTDSVAGTAFPDDWMGRDEDVSPFYVLQRDLPGMFKRELGFMKPLIRRNFLEAHKIRYATDIWAGEDLLLYIECLRRGARMRLMREAFYLYSLRPGSASSGRDANTQLKKVNERLIGLVGKSDPRLLALLRYRRILLNYELFSWYLRSRKFKPAIATAREVPAEFLTKKLACAFLRRVGFHLQYPPPFGPFLAMET